MAFVPLPAQMAYMGYQRRATAPVSTTRTVLTRPAPRISADECLFGGRAREEQSSRYSARASVYRLESVGGSSVEYTGSDEETAPLIDRTRANVVADVRTGRKWLRRRATEPQAGGSRMWSFRRPSGRVKEYVIPLADNGASASVEHIENLGDWGELHGWRRKVDAAEKKSGGVRMFSKKLSSGAASVKAVGKKCVEKVSNYCRADSAVASPQDEVVEPLLPPTPPSPRAKRSRTPYPFSAPAPCSDPEPRDRTLRRVSAIIGISPKAPVRRQRRLESLTTATDTYQASSPASFKSELDAANLNIFGPKPDRQAIDLWFSDFWCAFSKRERRGEFSDAWCQLRFDQLYGNNTCESQQLLAGDRHQFQARWDGGDRHFAKLVVQHSASTGVRRIRGQSVAYGEARGSGRPGLKRLFSKQKFANVAAVSGGALQRCSHVAV